MSKGNRLSRRPQQVFLHVGLPKTGTTFLQAVLAASRDQLSKHNISYPGRAPAHFLAAQDLAQHLFMGRENPQVAGAWRKVVRQTRRGQETVVISHELFTLAQPEHIRQAVDDLAPSDVHMILTVRDFERQIPAVWQERLKNGGAVSFARHFSQAQEFALQRHTTPLGFWQQQDAVAILGRWLEVVPKEQVHVITVPQRGAPPDLLWRRFAQVIGLAPEAVDLTQIKATGNVSLRPPEAKILRRVNQRLQDTLPGQTYRTVVKRYLTEVAVDAPKTTTRYGMTDSQLAQAQTWSEELVEFLNQHDLAVVGDTAELIAPRNDATPAVHGLDDVPPEEASASAVATTAALLRWLGDRTIGANTGG
jgi:hypothetical protein